MTISACHACGRPVNRFRGHGWLDLSESLVISNNAESTKPEFLNSQNQWFRCTVWGQTSDLRFICQKPLSILRRGLVLQASWGCVGGWEGVLGSWAPTTLSASTAVLVYFSAPSPRGRIAPFLAVTSIIFKNTTRMQLPDHLRREGGIAISTTTPPPLLAPCDAGCLLFLTICTPPSWRRQSVSYAVWLSLHKKFVKW